MLNIEPDHALASDELKLVTKATFISILSVGDASVDRFRSACRLLTPKNNALQHFLTCSFKVLPAFK